MNAIQPSNQNDGDQPNRETGQVDHIVRRRGRCQMIIMDKAIVTIGRKWRSKWWSVKCAGCKSRRRKDGTCKHERAVFEMLKPEIKRLARIAV